ncbi:hypothetical protein LOTGIDRAFT_233858 [Lottia gigantea]|uniref:Uncharacterized protein n=1 Tax=Lottia gigantea TaxID=225164 RepID=V3ZGP4_LOTGI|nr:hypothetical protein LOTGIDRAFT_233858 [Lottia gigantea]ESO90378.1 hypothetical protein LOTGIDRAFT_233858 [Lottia gigantea]
MAAIGLKTGLATAATGLIMGLAMGLIMGLSIGGTNGMIGKADIATIKQNITTTIFIILVDFFLSEMRRCLYDNISPSANNWRVIAKKYNLKIQKKSTKMMKIVIVMFCLIVAMSAFPIMPFVPPMLNPIINPMANPMINPVAAVANPVFNPIMRMGMGMMF